MNIHKDMESSYVDVHLHAVKITKGYLRRNINITFVNNLEIYLRRFSTYSDFEITLPIFPLMNVFRSVINTVFCFQLAQVIHLCTM
jgi:exoribonuclease II